MEYACTQEENEVFQENAAVAMLSRTLEASDTGTTVRLWAKQAAETRLQFRYSGGNCTIRGVTVTPTRAYAGTALIKLLLGFALLDGAVLAAAGVIPLGRLSRQDRGIGLALGALLLFMCVPLFRQGLFFGHDLRFHLTRIEGVAGALAAGELPARIYPNLLQGQGYANGIFYGDIFLYFPAALYLAGFSLQACCRVYVVLVNAATVLIAFRCFARMAQDRLLGLLGAVLYSLSQYYFMTQYVNAAMGQYTAMAFLPLVLYTLWMAFTRPADSPGYRSLWLPGALGCTGLALSHVLTCAMAALIAGLACLLCLRRVLRGQTLLLLAKLAAVTLLLCLWFLVPFADYMLTDTFRVTVEGHDIWNTLSHSLQPLQLFDIFGRSGGGSAVLHDGLLEETVYSPGAALLLGALVLPVLWLDPAFRPGPNAKGGLFLAGLGALTLWMTTTLFPWYGLCRLLPPLESFVSTMQFPWRFMAIAQLLLAAAAVLGLKELQAREKRVFRAVSLCLCFLAVVCIGAFDADLYRNKWSETIYEMSDIGARTDHTPFTKALVQISNAEYLPAGMDMDEVWLLTEPEYDGDTVTLTDYEKQGLTVRFTAQNSAGEPGTVTVPLIGYKGYRAWADGQELPVTRSEKGQVSLQLPAGFHGKVLVRFAEPLYWRGAEAVSLCTAAWLCGLALYRKMQQHRRKKNEKPALPGECRV